MNKTKQAQMETYLMQRKAELVAQIAAIDTLLNGRRMNGANGSNGHAEMRATHPPTNGNRKRNGRMKHGTFTGWVRKQNGWFTAKDATEATGSVNARSGLAQMVKRGEVETGKNKDGLRTYAYVGA